MKLLFLITLLEISQSGRSDAGAEGNRQFVTFWSANSSLKGAKWLPNEEEEPKTSAAANTAVLHV